MPATTCIVWDRGVRDIGVRDRGLHSQLHLTYQFQHGVMSVDVAVLCMPKRGAGKPCTGTGFSLLSS